MFKTLFEEIFTVKTLKAAFAEVSTKSRGLDDLSASLLKEDLSGHIEQLHHDLIKGRYRPEPLKRITIEKESGAERPVGIGSVIDKIVQRTLVGALELYFESRFNDKNYGYRKRKSSLDAINRCRDMLMRGNVWVVRADIVNFFETLSHDRLLRNLASHIDDPRFLDLIAAFLGNGSFERFHYIDHTEGIHQGDPLSPLLSNIYLNELDWFLQEQGYDFVRYVDDIAMFSHAQKMSVKQLDDLEAYLASIDLSLSVSKTVTVSAAKAPFDFLGVHFENFECSISKTRLDRNILNLHQLTRQIKPFEAMIPALNEHLRGLHNYYIKIIDVAHPQIKQLQDALYEALSTRVYIEKKRGTITTKGAFRSHLDEIEYPFAFQKSQRKDYIDRIILNAFEMFLAKKSYHKAKKQSGTTHKKYAKKFATSATVFLTEPGLSLGVAKNSITIKEKGRIVHQIPKTQCDRIIIAAKGISISSNVIELCAELGIAIDFIRQSTQIETPYAALYGHNHTYAKMTLLQLEVYNSSRRLTLAKAFIKGKSKNQLNYLKNLNRHHQTIDGEITAMERRIRTAVTTVESVEALMSAEGMIAGLYWQGVAKIIEDRSDFTGRVTRGADDLVNAALNYGYAILYGRVHHHAVKAGLSVNISFLHALDHHKPTLVYDMIEEFRAFVVDRTVISMINNHEPLKLTKDKRLDMKSRQLIAKNVLERLGTATRHKKATRKVDNIIADQAYLLARDIRGEAAYRPFIGRY